MRLILLVALLVTPPVLAGNSQPLTVSGWTQISLSGSSARRSNLPVGFNDQANDILLQQNWLRIDHSAIAGGTAPSFGYKMDWILGSDYRFTRARGLFDSQTALPDAAIGVDPIYFYFDAQFPKVARGMQVQLGRFAALFGAESNDTIKNALSSHSYTSIYDPFTHTGLVTTTRLDDRTAVQAGLVLGSDIFIDGANRPTFIGSLSLGPQDLSNTVLLSAVLGPGQFDVNHNFNNPNLFDALYTRKLSERLVLNAEALYGYQNQVPELGDVHWYGLLQYFAYTLDPKLTLNTRVELFGDPQGQRTGFAGQYKAFTVGLNHKPNKHWIFRGELRADINRSSTPFEGRHDLYTATADAVYVW